MTGLGNGGRDQTRLGKLSDAGEGLRACRDSGEPVTDDYSGQAPRRLASGTVNRVAIDVSGKPYVGLARETDAMFAIFAPGVRAATLRDPGRLVTGLIRRELAREHLPVATFGSLEPDELVSELAPLHPSNNTFPGEVFLHLAADALD